MGMATQPLSSRGKWQAHTGNECAGTPKVHTGVSALPGAAAAEIDSRHVNRCAYTAT